MNTSKETLRKNVKEMSELSYNSQRILKWINIVSEKVSDSPNFTGKEGIMKELKDLSLFIEINLVDDMSDLFNEQLNMWISQLDEVEKENENKIFQFENEIREGKYLEDIKRMSTKYIPYEIEFDEIIKDLIYEYRTTDNNDAMEFLSVYDSSPEECHNIIEREIYYYIKGNPEAMIVDDLV